MCRHLVATHCVGARLTTHYRQFAPHIGGVKLSRRPIVKYNPLHSRIASRPRARGLFLGRVCSPRGRNYCTAHPLRGLGFFGMGWSCPVDATVANPLCCDRRH